MCIYTLAVVLFCPCQAVIGYSNINIKALIQTTRQNEMPIKKYFTDIFSRRKHASNDPDCAFYYEREIFCRGIPPSDKHFPTVITRAHTSYDGIGAQSTLSQGPNSSGHRHYICRNSIKKRWTYAGVIRRQSASADYHARGRSVLASLAAPFYRDSEPEAASPRYFNRQSPCKSGNSDLLCYHCRKSRVGSLNWRRLSDVAFGNKSNHCEYNLFFFPRAAG